MTTVSIEIHFKTNATRITKRGNFPLKGKNPEEVAYQWWKHISNEMSFFAELEKVTVNSDQDITELVKEIESQVLRNIDDKWTLPFC
ncbi:hypothetical protein [Neobacillus ginsengisoli]|uniref:Uncharacterized protein n=1 Tax=Neobacillus ginsengisoli TaxID=904295 RepID=A0ABT9XSL7_9BACI|nr:hypothetical protein [Neobacillus ginsengisoli]MDQ0197939.1 hypothetical protein [Neobacillus ginsengisoli]